MVIACELVAVRGDGWLGGTLLDGGTLVGAPELDPYCTVRTNADLVALTGLGGSKPHSAPHTGTKALMLAVLEEGIRSYLGDHLRTREEAECWVRSRWRRSAFSFIVICETLGFEPSAVRRALRRLRANKSPPKAVGRNRPNARWRTRVRLPAPKRR